MVVVNGRFHYSNQSDPVKVIIAMMNRNHRFAPSQNQNFQGHGKFSSIKGRP